MTTFAIYASAPIYIIGKLGK